MGASLGGDVVQLHDVSKRFGKFEAVKSVSWSLRCGGVYGLIGENGAGKSTLIRMICGLTRPTAGRISLFEKTNCALIAGSSPDGGMPGRSRRGRASMRQG